MRRLLECVMLGLVAVASLAAVLFVTLFVGVLVEEHVTLKECRTAEEAQFEWFVYRCEHLWSTWDKTSQSIPFDDYWPARLPIWVANEQCRNEVRTRAAKERCDEKFDPHAPRI